jgi:cysteine-rich repeat protein
MISSYKSLRRTRLLLVALFLTQVVSASSTWQQKSKLIAPKHQSYYYFGRSVSIYGNDAIIGVPGDKVNGTIDIGSAYIYSSDVDGGVWTRTAKLTKPGWTPDAGFGQSVSLDNGKALIGSFLCDDHGTNAGCAFIYKREWISNVGWTWSEKGDLGSRFSPPAANDEFGTAVSLHDGYALVGAPKDDQVASDSGCAYVFQFFEFGVSNISKTKLIASDGTSGALLGSAVSMHTILHHKIALVGAPSCDNNGIASGCAYTFTAYTGDFWYHYNVSKLVASDGGEFDGFGRAVSLYGSLALIGAPYHNDKGDSSGAAYVFQSPDMGFGWTQAAKLQANDIAAQDHFAIAVSLYNNVALVTSPFDDDRGYGSGSAYIFQSSDGGSTWAQQQKLTPLDGETSDSFGNSASIHGDFALIAAESDLNFAGSAYVFGVDCGNGKIRGTEGCDDGNINSGDGCSDSCQVEDGWDCFPSGRRSVCVREVDTDGETGSIFPCS